MGYHSGLPDNASIAAQQAAGNTNLVTPAAATLANAAAAAGATGASGTGTQLIIGTAADATAVNALGTAGVTAVTGAGNVVLDTGSTLIDPRLLIAGEDLTDADATKNPGTDAVSIYTMPAATQTAARVITLGVTGTLISGVTTVWIQRRDLTANTLTIRNGGTNGTSIPDVVLPASPAHPTMFGATYDGADWIPHTVVFVQ